MTTYRNRTIDDNGVRLDGNLFGFDAIVGTAVTPAQAVALAAPISAFLASIPYYLDERGQLAYRTSTLGLTHAPELVYADHHPMAGQPIVANFNGGDYMTKHGGAPMPFIDMDLIDPESLRKMLHVLTEMQTTILNAT